jgi:hypothetical protein
MSTYHALALSASRRFSRGRHFLASCTASKNLTNSDGAETWALTGNGSQYARNYYDLSIEKALAGNDTPRSLVISYIYELPVGKGRLLGGWQVSGISSFTSGFPLSLWTATNNVNAFTGLQRPNVVGDPRLDDPTVDRWFNTAAFAQPSPFTFGNAPRTMPNLRSYAPNPVVGDPSLGRIIHAFPARSIQFGLKLYW